MRNEQERLSSFGLIVTICFFVRHDTNDTRGKPTTKERGVGLVEFALLVAIIAMVAIVSVKLLGNRTADSFCRAKGGLENETSLSQRFNPETGNCETLGFEQ
jgi:Flp pilus assembly pilin Flp